MPLACQIFGADIWRLQIFTLTLRPKKDTMDNKDFIGWMDAHIGEIADAMRPTISEDNPSRVYGDNERVVMSLTFPDGDRLCISDIADTMLTHYRAKVAQMMGDDVNRRQTMSGYPLEYAMTNNKTLLAIYYNLCARYARQNGCECVVSVSRY